MSAMPPPPPPVVPVADVGTARTSAAEAVAALEATLVRAAGLPEATLQQGVDGEWSTVQSLRHLVLVCDLWLSKMILGEDDPFHPMALPPSFMPSKLPGTSIDPAAAPTFEEAAAVLRDRIARVDAYLATLTAAELDRETPNHAKTVGGSLAVLLGELRAHTGFVNRDLDLVAPA